MKLLLDESIPRRLAAHFPDTFEIKTVPAMGWAGAKNGALFRLAADKGFRALITADQNIEHQQNLDTLPITIVVLIAHRTRIQDFQPLIPEVVLTLEDNPGKSFYRITARENDEDLAQDSQSSLLP